MSVRPAQRDSAGEAIETAGYSTEISEGTSHDEWDDFLASGPWGHPEQTTCWAVVEEPLGWRPVRILLRQGGRLAAGGQLLVRSPGSLKSVAYLRAGPAFRDDDPEARRQWVEALHAWARASRVTYVIVSPCAPDDVLVAELERWGYRPKYELLPPWNLTTATLLLDLSKSAETLRREMRRELRREIRIGGESELEFTEGGEGDLPRFFDLMKRTAERRGDRPIPADVQTLERIWSAFGSRGWVRLFRVRQGDETICTALIFPFGSTVRFWKYGWSGDQARSRPNQWLYWNLILWAREHGFPLFDIVQVEPRIAGLLRDGEPLSPEDRTHPLFGPTLFKLGFGGTVIRFPGAFYRFYNPLIGIPFRLGGSQLVRLPAVNRLVRRLL